ncbi:MAG: DUF3455 domain-containing protein [Burkholderiaceae bacterium]
MNTGCTASFLTAPALLAITGLAAGCGSAPPQVPYGIPAAIAAPAGQVAFLRTEASGVQVYECAAPAGQAPAWVFKGPEATLTGRSGASAGKHYGGPTWEGLDGGKVVGEVKASVPSPDAAAIPWLLLARKSTSGMGAFIETRSIQRIDTRGGKAPERGCDAAGAGRVERVPYTATYIYYR